MDSIGDEDDDSIGDEDNDSSDVDKDYGSIVDEDKDGVDDDNEGAEPPEERGELCYTQPRSSPSSRGPSCPSAAGAPLVHTKAVVTGVHAGEGGRESVQSHLKITHQK